MTAVKKPFSAFLLKEGFITPEKLSEAIQQSSDKKAHLSAVLLDSDAMERRSLLDALTKYFGLPFVDAKNGIDTSLFHLLPESVIRKYHAIPVKVSGKTMTVAMTEPDNQFSREYIQMVSGYLIEPAGIIESDLDKVMELYFAPTQIDQLVKDMHIPEVDSLVEEAVNGREDKPMARLVDTVITHAVRLSASDVHIEPQEKEFLVRFRIDGMLRTIEILPKHLHAYVVSRVKILSNMDIMERRAPQDGQIRMNVLDRDVDIRSSTLPARYGEKIVLRILDKTSFTIGMDQLGISAPVQTRLEEILTRGSGLLLVTGPTGSGKTTTLYSCLNRMRSPLTNIVTLEDPIEYELLAGKSREGGITQVQITPKSGFNFVEGLKATLRQDPDIIFVGEIRDRDSAEIAFTASLTGHFLLSSLHTVGSAHTVTRLLDMGVEPYLIVSTLRGVLAQRLVRVLCTHCKEAYKPPKKVLDHFALSWKMKVEHMDFYRPKGCPWCNKTGYRGRTGIFELMTMNDTLSRLILDHAPNSELLKAARASGMKTLRQSGLEQVTKGVTSIAEVMRVVPQE